VFRLGVDCFLASAKEHGVDGFIVPDLPVEEAGDYRKAAKAHGIETIFLAAPSTSAERLQRIVTCSSGFLYLVSHFGVTGARASLEDSTLQLVQRVKKATAGKVPLAVGFGISQPEHVRSVLAAGADGVIVGSAFVNIVSRNLQKPPQMLSELEAATRSLKKATQK